MSGRVRIGHVLPWTGVGGTEHATLRVAQATEGDRFENVVFCRAGAESVMALFADAGFQVLPFDPPEPSLRHAPAFLSDSRKFAALLRANEIDLLHCADFLAGFTAASAGRLAGIPVLCHIRNRFETVSRRDRIFLSAIQKFAFVSKDTWRRFDYRVAPDRGVVIYDGLDARGYAAKACVRDVRAEFGIDACEKIVGMVARVAPQKDYETLARAAAIVIKAVPETRFLIAGDKSFSAANRDHYIAVRAWLAAAGVEDRFIFTDSRTDVPRLIEGMDLFVLSTHHEGLPLVILEAMAQAKPVIATEVDGIPEVVDHNRTGLLYPHEDAAALAGSLISLLRNPDQARAMGDAGLETLRTRFSRENFAVNVRAAYEDLLAR